MKYPDDEFLQARSFVKAKFYELKAKKSLIKKGNH